jgi:hypothetical protein
VTHSAVREHRKINEIERINEIGWGNAVGVYLFRPQTGINTNPRHFWGNAVPFDLVSHASPDHMRDTAGQSTSLRGRTQGSASAARRQSSQAGKAATAAI